jgi:YesN/AraC family two-component response regulator
MYRVLIVDDEPEIARSLRRVLKGAYEVDTVESADEALTRLDELRPDIVISDFRMPDMNGAELLSDVRRRLPDSIRLLLSGYADLDAKLLGDHAGSISRFVKKPWKNDELLEILAELIDERERTGSTRPDEAAQAKLLESP